MIALIFLILKLFDRGLVILEAIDWQPIETILTKLKKSKGRPEKYTSIAKLKVLLYGFANNKHSALAIVRAISKPFVARILGLEELPSHDTILRFWKSLEPVIEEIFQELVRQNIRPGIIKGSIQAIDSTSIETKFIKSDKDAKWSYDETKKAYYFGYGLLVIFDCLTQLPIAALFTKSKKVCYKEIRSVWQTLTIIPKKLFGDGEFDIIDFHKRLMKQGIFPVILYNPRNTKQPLKIKYRIQQFNSKLKTEKLDEEYDYRAEAEHGFSTLKLHFGLENLHVKGWDKVKVHVFLCLTVRLVHAIAVHKNFPGTSVTKTISVL